MRDSQCRTFLLFLLTPGLPGRQLHRVPLPRLEGTLSLNSSSRLFHRTRMANVRKLNCTQGDELLLEGDAKSSGICTVLPSTVCERCARASTPSPQARWLAHKTSASRCKTSYRWSWQKPLDANDADNAVSGLRAVRGFEALREPGVEVVAEWRQSNWPALRRTEPVRAVSAADKARLCALWKGEHTYQAWSVMLGCAAARGKCRLACLCPPPRASPVITHTKAEGTPKLRVLGSLPTGPGRRPAEWEPLCRNLGALVRLRCAFVDFTQPNTNHMGGVYDAERRPPTPSVASAFTTSAASSCCNPSPHIRWLRDDQSRWPPNVCDSRRTVRVRRVAVAMSVYPKSVGVYPSREPRHGFP